MSRDDETLDLFGEAEEQPEDLETALDPAGPPALRQYQLDAVAAIREELADKRSTLAVMATGTGKTQVASEVIRGWQGRCLFVAHREELIAQAVRRIEQFTGATPDIERGEAKANRRGARNIVASVQSISRSGRLDSFDPDEFSLIVVDEVHHATANSYRRVLDYFASAKVLGLTATPDRLDGEALGSVCDSVAYKYDILEATADGWLAPIRIKQVEVAGLDFSKVHTLAGDFNQGELDTIMATEEALHSIAKPTFDLAGDRKTIVFTTSVQNAKRLAEILDRYAGSKKAMSVDGGTDPVERKEALAAFAAGRFQFFVNVGIATEGYDEPGIACVSMGRPTKSRALYCQMLGRGTRGGRNFPIAGKDDCLVLDFVGNSGRHDIVCAADILGGNLSDRELDQAKKWIDNSDEPLTVEEAMQRARESEERKRLEAEAKALTTQAERDKRKGIVAEVRYVARISDPFVAFNVKRDYLAEKYGFDRATERQIEGLQKWLGKNAKDLPPNLSRHEASRMLKAFADRRASGMDATYSQLKALAKFGIDGKQLSFARASQTIDAIAKNGWRVPAGLLAAREPGADG